MNQIMSQTMNQAMNDNMIRATNQAAKCRRKAIFSRPLSLLLAAAIAFAIPAGAQTKSSAPASSGASAAATDPILKTMHEELDRSKSQLKMDNVQAPYYIEVPG